MANASSPTKDLGRIASLDALRGIAAMVVVFSHVAKSFSGYDHPPANPLHLPFWANPFSLLKFTPAHLLLAGGTSVQIFFVLSGFVLAITLSGGKQTLGDYYVRRLFRIYPAYIAAVLVSGALLMLVRPAIGTSPDSWIAGQWMTMPSGVSLLGQFVLDGVPDHMTLDAVAWSLVHEVRISILFPLLLWLAVRRPTATLLITTFVSVAVTLLVKPDGSMVYNLLSTLIYLPHFVAGAQLALNGSAVRAWVLGLGRFTYLMLWIAVLFLLLLPLPLASVPIAIGATALVAFSITEGGFRRALESPVPVWLGRVSYSLYLLHLPILLACVHALHGRAPLIVALLLGVAIALVASEISYRLVERPTIRLGRALGRRVAASFTTRRPVPGLRATP